MNYHEQRMMAKINNTFDRSTVALFSKEIEEITKQAATDYSSALNNNRVFVSIMNHSLLFIVGS